MTDCRDRPDLDASPDRATGLLRGPGTVSCGDLASVLDGLPDVVLIVDSDVRVVWANRAAEAFAGMSLEDAIGMNALDLIHPDDLEMALLSVARMGQVSVGRPLELRARTASGWKQVELVGASRPEGLVMVIRDLTDRRRWEIAHDSVDALRTVLQHISTVTMVLEESGVVRSTSAALTRLLGIGQLSVEGTHITTLLPGAHRSRLGRALHTVLAEGIGARRDVDVHTRRADGTTMPVLLSLTNLVEDPTVNGVVLTMHDMTWRVEVERRLEGTNAALNATLDAVADAVVAVDLEGRITACNQLYQDMWGLPPGDDEHSAEVAWELVRRTVERPDAYVARILEINADLLGTSEETVHFVDGRVIERRSRPQLVDGEPVGRVWTFRDVTATRDLQLGLVHMAHHDPLTGLANQVLFRERIEAELVERDDRPCAVMFVDLDGFKAVNDGFGHSAGDILLVEVARRLDAIVRSTDTVARIGGDEFAVLLTNLEAVESAIDIARRLLESLASPVAVGRHEVAIGASIGIAVSQPDSTYDILLHDADLAMYSAKSSGRNQFRVFHPELTSASGLRVSADPRLRDAVARDELVVHFQPVVDPARGDAIVAMEALVRWQHPERGLVMPNDFIPYAERSGLIDAIGMRVLEIACSEARRWAGAVGAASPMVSVNLSPHQLLDEHLPDQVAGVIDATGVDPNRIVLEFTESALMQDPAVVASQLREIRRTGVRLAIDDFGTGHSSLSRLQQFPIDSLKIDRSFVQQVQGRTGSSLVLAVVQLAHTLDMLTVAEGVETPDQLARLDELGADLVQGYLYYRPMDAESAMRLLLEHDARRRLALLGEAGAPLR